MTEKEMTGKELKAIGKKIRAANDLSKLKTETTLVKDTLFSDAEGNDVSSLSKANQYSLRWTDPENEHREIINVYYLSGKLKEEFFQIDNPQIDFNKPPHWYYKDKDTGHTWYLHGLRRAWYESGQLKREVMFDNGNIKGRIVSYWENGKLKRTNVDANGKEMPTQCFDETGKEVPVYPFATTGKFNDGKTTVADYLNEHIIYPKEAIERSIEGTVEVVINIQPDGTVGNIKTVKSDHPLLETELKRVIRTMPKWSKGTYDGEPVSYVSSAKFVFRLPEQKIYWMKKLANRDTTFYDKTGMIVVDKLNADSYEILSPDTVDANKAIERVYFISGKMRSEKNFLKSDLIKTKTDSIEESIGIKTFSQKEINQLTRQTEGRYREWYENGQLSKDFYIESGKKNGNLIFYWGNGTLRRTGTYTKGVTENGECYTNNGIKIPYFEADMPSSYPGGKEAMNEYLKINLQYPSAALEQNKQGTVHLKFVVNNTGFISRIWIPKSLDKDLDMEAIRLIRKMPKWLAEFKDGDPVSSIQSLDVNFFIK